ncbi:MAG: hypothetical protein H6728_16010 [Myxococcales bacterium]|nr:hypothetical protein [Myxococcales bacterium]MCB9644579.1 hypothetical protein [Myxococcales bacterium]
MTKQTRLSAYLLIATGLIHNALGLVMGFAPLAAIAKAGFFHAVDPHMDRRAIFWFLFAGFAMMMWGQLVLSMRATPRGFAYSLLALGCVGAFLMPISGFWLVIPQAFYMLRHTPPTQAVAA